MASVKVTAPTKFTGDRAGVFFRDGQAVADSVRDAAAVAYFRRRGGYKVTEEVEPSDGEGDGSAEANAPEALDRPAARDSKETWAAYAQSLGIDVDGMSKPEIVDAVDVHEATVNADRASDDGEGDGGGD